MHWWYGAAVNLSYRVCGHEGIRERKLLEATDQRQTKTKMPGGRSPELGTLLPAPTSTHPTSCGPHVMTFPFLTTSHYLCSNLSSFTFKCEGQR